MSTIRKFIKRNAVLILHIFCTFFLCVILSLFFNRFSDYLLFGNLILALIGVYFLYKMIFKKTYSDSFLKIVCILAMLTSSNHLYSLNKLNELFPWIANVNSNWLVIGLIATLIVILLIFKLLTYIEPQNRNKTNNYQPNNTQLNSFYKHDGLTNTENENYLSDTLATHRKDFFSFLRFLCILLSCCIIMILPAVLLFLFNKYSLDTVALDFDKIFSFILSYGASFILILFAIIIVIITLVYVAKYVYVQIRSFKKANDEDSNKSYPVPTYAFSVIIVCSLLFLAWRLSDISLNDLTQKLIIGDYLALPIAVVVIIVLFFLLVQITHAIILMLSSMSAESIKQFIIKQENKLKIGARIFEVVKNIIDIILNTILSTLEFVNSIPNFIKSLSKMVLYDDDFEESEDCEKK